MCSWKPHQSHPIGNRRHTGEPAIRAPPTQPSGEAYRTQAGPLLSGTASCWGALPAEGNKVSVLMRYPGSRTTSTRVGPSQLYPEHPCPVSTRWARSPLKLYQDREHGQLREQEGWHSECALRVSQGGPGASHAEAGSRVQPPVPSQEGRAQVLFFPLRWP